MTNKEFLEKLTPEELVQTYLFTNCPYGELYIQIQENKGNHICNKKIALSKMKSEDVVGFVSSGKQKAICNSCKLNWLSQAKD